MVVSLWQGALAQRQDTEIFLDKIVLPEGFHIELMTDKVNDAYGLAASPKGRVFVGTRSRGSVYIVEDTNGDGKAENVYTLARGLKFPAGLIYKDGTLYIAGSNSIVAIDDVDFAKGIGRVRTLVRTLPPTTHNGKRTLAFGPDGLLYITLGAPCNSCKREAETYAVIARLQVGTPNLDIFASGVRYATAFDWHPETKEMWFVDACRSGLEKVMPDELNRAPRAGLHFGFPYFHGMSIPDPDFGKERQAADVTAPVADLGVNVNAMGMLFYRGDGFPAEYKNSIFIAENGSRQLQQKTGYRISNVTLRNNKVIAYKPFAEGWLNKQSGSFWGQPVDIVQLPDGGLAVADSKANAVYKISHR